MLAATYRNGLRRVLAFEDRRSAERANVPGFERADLEAREVDIADLGAELAALRLAVDMCETDDDGVPCVVHAVIATLDGDREARTEHIRYKLERDFDLPMSM